LGKEYFPLTGAHNPVSNLSITGFSFDTATIRSVHARYYVHRETTTTEVVEAGTILLAYNASNSVGNKWEISVDKVGDASCTFSITDAGQVQLTNTALGGTGHTGTVGFTAQVLDQ
jgi:hypothetical protein